MANRRLRQAPRPNDAYENKVYYITTRGSLDDVNDAAQSRNEKLNDDVSKRNEVRDPREMQTLISRMRPFTPKIKKTLCRICPKDRKTMQILWKKIFLMKAIHKILRSGG